MKTKTIFFAFVANLLALSLLAQDRTTVSATSSEISDNLDLRAIASIFGQAINLEDFERQLNNPDTKLSNLDLNEDNKVDYLRVIESAQDNTHLIIVQAVLGKDLYQDVATIEVEKDHNNKVQVQIVGDVYMYGENHIYEPVYVTVPVIYNTFWLPRYRPYCSVWYWGYYPTYYYAWTPFPVFRYRHNINIHINFYNHYNYVTTRSCTRAVAMYQPIRANYCERTYPTRAFAYRNTAVKNSYELSNTRTIRNVRYPNDVAYNNTYGGRTTDPIKQSIKSDIPYENTRNTGTKNDPIQQSTRNNESTAQNSGTGRSHGTIRTNDPIRQSNNIDPTAQNSRTGRSYGTIRTNDPIKQSTRSESNSIERQNPDRGTRSPNRKGTYTGQRTRFDSNPGFERGNSGSRTTRSYEGPVGSREPRAERSSGSERRAR